MNEETRIMEELRAHDRTFLRIGAVCAILGAVVSVAAGAGFGNLMNMIGIEAVLRTIAARPDGYWPVVHLGFMLGAFLWVGAFAALAGSLRHRAGWALGRWGLATVIIGAAVHVVDSSINGFALAALADTWATAPPSEQARLLHIGSVLLQVLDGTWAGVLNFFHGLPFVLFGLATIFSPRYPAWLGGVGVIGGAGSLVAGVLMFVGADFVPEWLFIVFAVLVSLWMVAMGVLMWRCGARTDYVAAESRE